MLFLGITIIIVQLYTLRRIKTMANHVEQLRAAIAELQSTIAMEASELRTKFDNLTSKILDLTGQLRVAGDPDVDLTPEIEAIRASISSIQGLSGQEAERPDQSGT